MTFPPALEKLGRYILHEVKTDRRDRGKARGFKLHVPYGVAKTRVRVTQRVRVRVEGEGKDKGMEEG